jgi:putative Ca2+/H+ antiporter (TMEM165/GDT1 family)
VLTITSSQKPADLPDKPHDIPHPGPKGYTTPDTLTEPPHNPQKSSSSASNSDNEEPAGVIQPLHSFLLSLTMILFSEVGDKTFLIAALMAMRHARLLVFSAAFSALITMTVLSAVLGHAVPTLLPKKLTNFAAAVLFLIFGAKMLREGLAMSPNEGVGEEMKEVEMELEEKEHLARRNSRRSSNITPYILEAGRGRRSRSDSRLPAPRSPSTSPSRSPSPNRSSLMAMMDGASNLLSLLLSPAWVQTFVMTFLGEWGDRSQIATIAMAAGQDYWWVTGGAISGHACCTAVAVLGGRAIAGKVSVRYGKFPALAHRRGGVTNSWSCSNSWWCRRFPGLRRHLSRRSPSII